MVKKHLSFFIAGLSCLALAMTFLIWSLVELKGELAARQTASLLQGKLDDFLESIQLADIHFLKMQNSKSMADYNTFSTHVNLAKSELQDLQTMASGNSKVTDHLKELRSLMERKIEVRRQVSVTKSPLGTIQLRNQAMIKDDLISTNSMRSSIQAIDQILEGELNSRADVVDQYWGLVMIFLFSTLSVSIGFLSYAAHLVIREFRLRTKTEHDLRLAQESAVTISNLKSQFVATVSHEIRTPLNAIIGMSDILASRVIDNDLNRFAKLIHSSGRSLLRIVNDILDFSKIEANKIQFENQRVPLDEIFESAFELYAKAPKSKGLRFYVTYDYECRSEFYLDGSRLSQILHNLISNALKFTAEGFVIVHGSVKSGKEGESLFCEVKDSGVGISEESIACLFQPFQQIKSWHNAEGTGLGLAISKRLVDAMGGWIEVESQVGKGSTFRFEIPLCRAELQNAPDSQNLLVPKPLETDKKILWIDRIPTYSLLAGVNNSYLPLVHWISDIIPENIERIYRNVENYKLIVVAREFCDQIINIHYTTLLDHCSPRRCEESLAEPRVYLETDRNSSSAVYESEKSNPLKSFPDRRDKGWILAVEDNATNQILIEAQLRQLGYSVRCANHGEECLQVLSQFKCDLVLMDCRMPVMDGYVASTHIREREMQLGLPRIPILAMTANVTEEDRRKCLTSGMDAILVKPLELEDLKLALDRWISTSIGLIDWGVVNSLSGKTNPSVVKRIIESYSLHLTNLLLEIEVNEKSKTTPAHMLKQYEIWAHRLRSSSLMVGALPLADICKSIEELGSQSKELDNSTLDHFRSTIFGTLEELRNQKMY